MIKSTLALNKNPIMLVRKINHHLLHHPCHKVADDTINWQTIIRDHNTCLSSSDKGAIQTAITRLAIQFKSNGHFAYSTVRAYHEDSMATRAMRNKLSDAIIIGWAAYIPDRHTTFLGSSTKFLVI